jgi:membrane protease YdiL (CAAX protease family)
MEVPPLLNKPPVRRRWWLHLLLITAYIVTIGLLGVRRKPSHVPALLHGPEGLLLVCGFELVLFGSIFGLACWASRATLDDLRLRWRGNVLPVVLGIGYSVALRLAVAMTVFFVATILIGTHFVSLKSLHDYLLANRPDVEALVDLKALGHNPAYYWLTLTLVSFVVAGLREELWRSAFLAGMRALWPRWFGTQTGQVLAVFVAAVLFGSAHLAQGVVAAVAAGLLGVGLGLIMVFHRSIWPAVIAHGMFDATTFAVLPYMIDYLK